MRRNSQVLTDIKHGGHVTERAPVEIEAGDVVGTPFDYLFPGLSADPDALLPADHPARVVAALNALGDAMVEGAPLVEDPLQSTGNSVIPPVYTYWGQFIDHDLTANTDRDSAVSDITRPNLSPLPPDFVVANLRNLRQPAVNLDSLYGDGPTFDPQRPTEAGEFYDGVKFKIGSAATVSIDPTRPTILGVRIPPNEDLDRDLPRLDKKAQIADARNDENLIIAQFHTAFLRFHNNAVDWIVANEPGCARTEAELFERAQQLTRWHYQWLVVNDYLKTVTLAGIPDKVLFNGPKHFQPCGEPFMPLEFSVAAYRFGHTMVRAAYDHNRNFGRPGRVLPNASFDLLFLFTGEGSQRGPNGVVLNPFQGQTDRLPFNWIIEWDRLVDKGSRFPDHFARKIDTHLAPPLKDLINQGNQASSIDIRKLLKRLARRNLLRGYLLSIPTGQSIAREMGIEPLTPAELSQGGGVLAQVLEENGFLDRTPLWFYVLKEAEVRANGNSLGELGSRIICETIIGQLLSDEGSYLRHQGGWHPGLGVKQSNGDPIVTIGDFIRFAGIPA